jgi:hypothetical protein
MGIHGTEVGVIVVVHLPRMTRPPCAGEALQEMPQPVELGLIGGSDRRSTPTMADTALVAGRSSIARNVPTSPSCGIAYNLVTKG